MFPETTYFSRCVVHDDRIADLETELAGAREEEDD